MTTIKTSDEIIILTAGGAGMFCGSCMQDNTLARGLREIGEQVTLVPLYTPIRVDEQNIAESQVFFGGLNIYLNDKIPIWRYLPRTLTRWLDNPAIIKWATSFGVSNQAQELGELTISMLLGDNGPHLAQINELVNYLTLTHHPKSILFSNVLISGTAPHLRKNYRGHLGAIIQGDDLFLDQLPESYRQRSIELIRRNVTDFDCFYTHSEFYRDYMSRYLGLPPEKFRVIPLGLDFHQSPPRIRDVNKPFTIGYFARIASEKGFLQLTDAFRAFHHKNPQVRLKAGGYLASVNQPYFELGLKTLGESQSAFDYAGSPVTLAEKSNFYQTIDVLTVPVQFEEPKGLYALEAMSHGVPVVLPDKGALKELVMRTQGGLVYDHQQPDQLLSHWQTLLDNHQLHQQLSQTAYSQVRLHHQIQSTARQVLNSIQPGVIHTQKQ